MNHSDQFLSVIVVLHPVMHDPLDDLYAVARCAQAESEHFEVVVVDACTPQAERVVDLARKEAWLRVIRLAKPYSFDVAALAGLESSIGDMVVVLRQDRVPPESIRSVVQLLRKGVEVVHGTPIEPRNGLAYRLAARTFGALVRLVGLQVYPSSSLFGLSRLAAQALTRERRCYPHLGPLVANLGHRRQPFEYQPRSQAPSYGLLQGVDRGITLLSANSISPLRFVTCVGVAAGLFNLVYVLYVFLVNCLKRQVMEGWTTLSLQISCMFFLVFVILVLMSEYLRHIHEASTQQPRYQVFEEVGSSSLVSLEATRNVLGNATDTHGPHKASARVP